MVKLSCALWIRKNWISCEFLYRFYLLRGFPRISPLIGGQPGALKNSLKPLGRSEMRTLFNTGILTGMLKGRLEYYGQIVGSCFKDSQDGIVD